MSTVNSSLPPSFPEQIPLFDLGLNLSKLRDVQNGFMSATRAVNTLRAYAHSCSVFDGWCEHAGRRSHPPSVDTVRLFVSWCLASDGGGYRLASVRLFLAGLSARCRREGLPVPVDDSVRLLLACAARALQEEPAGKLPITPSQLASVCSLPASTPVEIRDRAIMLVGFATGFRASDLSCLRLADVRWVERGFELWLRRSKNDQVGEGRRVGIPPGKRAATCPVKALRAWVASRGSAAGPLFLRAWPDGSLAEGVLSPRGICSVVQRALDRVGIDSAPYGAHSLRAGFVTAAADAGSSELSIMRRTGHKSTAMVLRYFRPAQAFAVDPLAGVL